MISLEYIYDKFNGELEIHKKGEWVPLKKGYCKEFDLDLKFGKMGEEFVQGVLEGDSKIEIKTERDNAQKWLRKWGTMPEFNQYGMICGLKK